RPRDTLGVGARPQIVLPEREVRAGFLDAAGEKDGGRGAGRYRVAELGPGVVLEEDARGLLGGERGSARREHQPGAPEPDKWRALHGWSFAVASRLAVGASRRVEKLVADLPRLDGARAQQPFPHVARLIEHPHRRDVVAERQREYAAQVQASGGL